MFKKMDREEIIRRLRGYAAAGVVELRRERTGSFVCGKGGARI